MNLDQAANECLACASKNLSLALDLRQQPPANTLLNKPSDAYKAFPLGIKACSDCGHGQVNYFVPPHDLFNHYHYVSGTSQTLRDYFAWFAAEMTAAWTGDKVVLDIGCNDGSLLAAFADCGWTCYGVDAAENITAKVSDPRLKVQHGFWPCATPGYPEKFPLIVAQNVAAHTPNPQGFMQGVSDRLMDDGFAFIQSSQAMMLQQGDFDTIYHEHFSFYTGSSMRALAARSGLQLSHTLFTDIHGVSAQWILTKHGNMDRLKVMPLHDGRFAIARTEAEKLFFGSGPSVWPAIYTTFREAAEARMADVKRLCDEHKADGYTICFVGCAAKAITFMRAAEIKPDAFIDQAVQKIGLYIPGFDVPITGMARVTELPEKTLFVISAWNFRTELEDKVRETRGALPCKFLTYFPEIVMS